MSSLPTQHSQLIYCYNWQNFESSDWISSSPSLYYGAYDVTGVTSAYPVNTSSLPIMQAHTGDKFLGFGPCEGAQIELTSSVSDGELVTVSFWFSPRTKEDTEINIYLFKDPAQSSALNDCNNPSINFQYHDVIPVHSSGNTPDHIPGIWYFYQSKPFLVKGDDDWDWFAIKGRNTGGKIGSREYVYVDDVSVSKMPVCYNICPGDLPKPTFQMLQCCPNILINAIIGNSGANWFMTVKDATEIEFKVFSNATQVFFEYHAYDPNGLKDPGYNDYAFEWNGEDDNGNTVQFGFYNYDLTIKNCDYTLHYEAKPLLIFPAQSTPIQHQPTQNHWLEPCCKPNATFNNITFQNGFREDVDDYINAGLSGPTIVPSNATVKFYAGNNITLGPGFQANGNFVADIVPCATYNQVQRSQTRRDFISQESIDSLLKLAENKYGIELETQAEYEIFPNPSNGVFNLKHNFNSTILKVEVFNIYGKLVLTKNFLNNGYTIIDLSNQAQGVYFIKLISDNKTFTSRVIKQ